MDANTLWNVFLETGSPEVYLLYRRAADSADNETQKISQATRSS